METWNGGYKRECMKLFRFACECSAQFRLRKRQNRKAKTRRFYRPFSLCACVHCVRTQNRTQNHCNNRTNSVFFRFRRSFHSHRMSRYDPNPFEEEEETHVNPFAVSSFFFFFFLLYFIFCSCFFSFPIA